jgi:hypothetical protein
LELEGENWDSGVFRYGEFKNAISFEIRAMGGLQTGSKKSQKMKILSEWGENWDLGVFGHGEFKNNISLMLRATSGLQTGLKYPKI